MSAKTRRNAANPSANGAETPDNRITEILNGPGFGNGPVQPGILSGDNNPEQTETPANPDNPPETPASGRKPRDKRENYNPAGDAENLSALGFGPASGGNYYTQPDADGGFFALERVVQGGRYYLIRYVRPAGSPLPRPLFRTPFEPVFYPR